MKFYRFCVTLLSAIIKGLFRVEIVNAENEPENIPVLVCSNHISMWDPIIIAVCLKKPVHFMGKIELFKIPGLSFIIKSLGAFPVTRGGVDVMSIRAAINYLKGGENVCMFPQGTRYAGKELRETAVKNGAGMVVMRANSAALPVCVVTKGNKIRLFKKVTIVIGSVIPFETFENTEKTKEGYEIVSSRIFDDICKLNDEYAARNGGRA